MSSITPDPAPTSSTPTRRSLVWRRWSDVFLMGILGGGLVALGVMLVSSATWAAIITTDPRRVAVGVACLILVLAISLRGRYRAELGFRHFGSYPPVLASSLLGIGVATIIVSGSSTTLDAMLLPRSAGILLFRIGVSEVLLFGLLVLLSILIVSWRTRRGRSTDGPVKLGTPPALPVAPQTFESLSRWIGNDDPSDSPEDDLFGRTVIARRVASRLLQPNPPAQAVVGPLGAGKTTLRKLVERTLAGIEGNKTRIVNVELWPFETTRAAVEGVIRKLVDALKSEVSVLPLRGLPESYAQAMSAVGGIWSVLPKIQGTPSSPFDSLKRLNEIAAAIDVRFVVWVEDLERFAPGQGPAGAPESIEDTERLNAIRALLYGLDSLDAVSVITATTSLHTRFDLEKIARFVEELPSLKPDEVAGLIYLFRKGCRAKYDDVVPVSESSKKLDSLAEPNELLRSFFGSLIHGIGDALPLLCSTPRTLKQALRSVQEDWERLHGEIDFDDLLVATVLRVGHPRVFALVERSIEFLRSRNYESRSTEQERQASQQKWNSELQGLGLPENEQNAVSIAVDFLFPTSQRDAQDKLQGVARRGGPNYWQRLLTRPELSEAERDQPILRQLASVKSGLEVVELLEGPKSDIVEGLSRVIPTDLLVNALVAMVRKHVDDDVSTWRPEGELEQYPQGFIPLWRMLLNRGDTGELAETDVVSAVRESIEICVPKNLTFAEAIDHYFLVAATRRQDLISEEARAELKAYFRKLVVERLKDRPKDLAMGLAGGPSATLYWIVWGLDRIRANEAHGIPFAEWPEFAPTILGAASRYPTEMAGQVAIFVTKSTGIRVGDRETFQFDPDSAVALFGSVDALFSAFKDFRYQGEEPWTKAMFEAAEASAARSS